MAVAVEHGPTYRYIDKLIVTIDQSQQQVKQLQQQMQQQSQQLRQQLQQLHQQSQQVKQLQQQLLDNQRDRANAAAKHTLKMFKRNAYSGYDEALSDYLFQVDLSNNFQDEAVQIFNNIWNQENPGAAV